MKTLYVVPLLLFLAGCPVKENPDYMNGDGGMTGCTEHSQCMAPEAPICGADGQCRGCGGNAECVERDEDFPTCMGGACLATCTDNQDCNDPGRPYCGDGDTCVECLDSSHCGNRICDQSAGLCTACTEHFQCGSGACDQASGDCVAAADIIYVDKNHDMADDLGDCNDATPCATIGGAINRIKMALDGREIIVVRGDAAVVYDESLVIDGIKATLIGSGATIRPALNQAGVLVNNGADLTIEGFTITGAAGDLNADGIRCSGAVGTEPNVRLHRVTITGNAATGVETSNCTVSITRSKLSSNTFGAIRLTNSSFHIVNNFIVNNGNIATNTYGGVAINNFGDADQAERTFAFNTIVGNQANTTADSKGVRCQSDNPTVAVGNIVHGNLGEKPTISGTCTWTYSIVEGGAPGTGNLDAAPVFVDAGANNFHLQPGSPGIDVDGLTSDISVDYDGDTRPQNTLFDMGADEVVPPEMP